MKIFVFQPGKGGVGFAMPLHDKAADDEFAPEMSPGEQAFCTDPGLMASMEKNQSLDYQKRTQWMKKMQGQAGVSPESKSCHGMDQPESITVDDETAEELASSSLTNMLQQILVSG